MCKLIPFSPDLGHILDKLCLCAFKVTPGQDFALTIKGSEYFPKSTSWKYLLSHCFNRGLDGDHTVLSRLSADALKVFLYSGQEHEEVIPTTQLEYGQISFDIYNTSDKNAVDVYIVVRDNKESSLYQRIVNMFVFNNCDYFVFIDSKNNRYVMFSGNPDVALPPVAASDYEAEVISYADKFVAPAERDIVIKQMLINNVVEQLDRDGVYTFYAGVVENGIYKWKRCEYRYFDKQKGTILLYRTDVTDLYYERERHAQELKSALTRAYTDSLTGVNNRTGFLERSRKRLKDASGFTQPFAATAYALLFIDLDNFKKVNDTYGHAMGDRVLCEVASIMREICGSDAIVSRLGGDEFVILLGGKHDTLKRRAVHDAEQILSRVMDVNRDLNIDVQVSGSIGVSFFKDGDSVESLMQRGDDLAYAAKYSGKASVYAED